MTRYFINVTLPSLLFATVWLSVIGLWLKRRLRAYQAARQALQAQHRAIRRAQDVLAMVISEAQTPESVRDQALPAYEALSGLIKEREIS